MNFAKNAVFRKYIRSYTFAKTLFKFYNEYTNMILFLNRSQLKKYTLISGSF